MNPSIIKPQYRNITVSGKLATGKTVLAKHLTDTLKWQYRSASDLQREYDKKFNIDSNKQGAVARPDEHELEIENLTKEKLKKEDRLIYVGWLTGFISQGIPGVLKVLLVCSDDAVRIDRIANRDGVSIEEAKQFIKQREEENIIKWKKLYGDHDFWDPKLYDLVIDTYSSGPMQTLGLVLDKLNAKK